MGGGESLVDICCAAHRGSHAIGGNILHRGGGARGVSDTSGRICGRHRKLEVVTIVGGGNTIG